MTTTTYVGCDRWHVPGGRVLVSWSAHEDTDLIELYIASCAAVGLLTGRDAGSWERIAMLPAPPESPSYGTVHVPGQVEIHTVRFVER